MLSSVELEESVWKGVGMILSSKLVHCQVKKPLEGHYRSFGTGWTRDDMVSAVYFEHYLVLETRVIGREQLEETSLERAAGGAARGGQPGESS